MTKKKRILQHNTVEKENIIEKSIMCKARYKDGLMYINFKGFGLVMPNVNNHTEPEVEVFYEGEIGKANFKYKIK